MVLSPDDRILYATLNGEDAVVAVDVATGDVLGRVQTGQRPRSMDISDDGTALYVVNYDSDTMSKIRTSDLAVLQQFDTAPRPIGITYDPLNDEVWVSTYSGAIHVFAETAGTPREQETDGTTTATSTEPAGAAAGVGDSLYPQLGNAGYDVLHYSIELDVDPAANTISSLTTITALATEDLAAFNLDLSGLEVHDVTVDGEAAAFSRSGTELTVRPSRAPAVGEEFSVSVGYSGSPEPIDDPGVPFSALGWHWRDGVIYTLSEPSGAMTWFPSNNHPSDKATFELRITVPESTTAAATGLLIDESTAGGRTTTTWRMDDPMATYLAAVYVGDFERIEGGRLGPGRSAAARLRSPRRAAGRRRGSGGHRRGDALPGGSDRPLPVRRLRHSRVAFRPRPGTREPVAAGARARLPDHRPSSPTRPRTSGSATPWPSRTGATSGSTRDSPPTST